MGSSRVFVLSLLAIVVAVSGQYYEQTTPVPILKQINRHNEDGSYSYGYEAADGSYKIETKHPTGEVLGKYGYVDDAGSLREVEYGASRRGFEPAGTGINVAPPTLTNNNNNNYYRSNAVGEDYDDGQYHEDPSVYYKNAGFNSQRPAYQPQISHQQHSAPSYQQPSYSQQPSYNQQPSHNYNYNDNYNNNYNPQPSYQQHYNAPQQQPYYPKLDPQQFRGHPATNFDVYSGSYSVNYSG